MAKPSIEELKNLKLVKVHFLDWLYSQEPTDIVGVRGETGCCPLATYLRDITKWGWDVGCQEITLINPNHSFSDPEIQFDLPEWAVDFIDIIDSNTMLDCEAVRNEVSSGLDVTVQEAINALHSQVV